MNVTTALSVTIITFDTATTTTKMAESAMPMVSTETWMFGENYVMEGSPASVRAWTVVDSVDVFGIV